ncbi:MAG: hypothetical protein JST40_10865 [Armatimonadetes bacterium]|nr:hypothetical protein [Armatimonadota bacterium]
MHRRLGALGILLAVVVGCGGRQSQIVGRWRQAINAPVIHEVNFDSDGTYEDQLFPQDLRWTRSVRGSYKLEEDALTLTPINVQFMNVTPDQAKQIASQLPPLDMKPEKLTIKFGSDDEFSIVPKSAKETGAKYKRRK